MERVSAAVATLSEAESKALLARHGVPVPAEAVVDDPAGAAEAAAGIGFPVAVKLCGPAIAHKTERGLVKLGLREAAAVEAAGAELLAAARPEDGDVALLVSAMVAGARELIAGFVRDDDFGPCVMLGIGGILAEAVGDVAFRLAPLDAVDAEDLIDDLAHGALLGPVRGEPPVDRAALAAILLGLSALGGDDERIRSIDLNPLIVSGGVPVAVDALVELDG
ncbi:MAG TPA: acetate--CoA ligase family protein [Acidimicrobiia bacterium]|nr:acetate--CoA ligase family protein [Acidimicrobiia bacterium]